MQHDIDVLTGIWERVKKIDAEHDTKLQQLRQILSTDLKRKKVLIFTYYKDTARSQQCYVSQCCCCYSLERSSGLWALSDSP